MCFQWRVMKLHDFNITSSEPRQFANRKRGNFQRQSMIVSFSGTKVCETEPWTPAIGKNEVDGIKNYLFLVDWSSTKEIVYFFFGGIHRERKFLISSTTLGPMRARQATFINHYQQWKFWRNVLITESFVRPRFNPISPSNWSLLMAAYKLRFCRV